MTNAKTKNLKLYVKLKNDKQIISAIMLCQAGN